MEQKSPMDSKTIVAIVVCMAVWFGWQKYLEKKYPALNQPVVEEAVKTTTETASPQKDAKKEKAVLEKALSQKAENLPEKTWVLDDSTWKIVISSRGGRISEAHLKKFTQKDTKEMTLVSSNEPGLLMIAVEKGSSNIDFSKTNFEINKISTGKVELVGSKDGVVVKKTLSFDPEKYLINSTVEVLGEGLKTVSLTNGVNAPKEESQGFSLFGFSPPSNSQEFFVLHKNKKEREVVNPKEDLKKTYEQATLAALGTRYFSTIFINKGNVLPNVEAEKTAEISDLKVIFPVLEAGAGKADFKFELFVGPKSVPLLKSIDPAASQVVDYGMFYIIAHPLLLVMKWFYSLLGNWGMAIIFLTILVRMITFPFTYMAYKSTSALQRLQPEVARLKEKYKGDTQTFNTEMMKLYKENKVNPVGGCLPTLLQLPVFWALFQVLQNSIELYHAPFFGWIHDLSQKDPYYVLPVLMGIAMFFQTKLTPTTMDPAQAKMMQFMPVFFSLLMFGLPSGLTLYIFVSTVFGIIQQLVIMDKTKTGTVALATK